MTRHPGEPWLQLTIRTDHPELVEAVFEAEGALAITLAAGNEETLIEPDPGALPLWGDTEVCGLFEADNDPASIVEAVRQGLGTAESPDWRAGLLEDRDWVRAWMDDYRPMRFGERLWVCPRHKHVEVRDSVVLHLDPGLAFGTGSHATTALCLEWLDAHPPAGWQVIDYGCGSGILGIAAALLGAARVRATDIDPQALTATQDNALANGVADRLSVHEPGRLPADQADLLMANILAAPLIELAPRLADMVGGNGRLLLSGLLADQAEHVKTAYDPWFEFDPPAERSGWVRLDGSRRGTERRLEG